MSVSGARMCMGAVFIATEGESKLTSHDCSICNEPFDKEQHRAWSLKCGHIHCEFCIAKFASCPTCRSPIPDTMEDMARIYALEYFVEELRESIINDCRPKYVERPKNKILSKGNALKCIISEDEIEFDNLRHVSKEELVCSARIGKQQRVSVAIKACTLRRCDIERYSERILILQKICHPNAVQFYGVVELSGGNICIVTEACHRNLYDLIYAEYAPLSAAQVLKIASQIASALVYLHSIGVCHGDLGIGNIMLSNDGIAKLSVVQPSTFSQGNPSGLEESCLQQIVNDKSADIYSFGVALWELWFREAPYLGISVSAGNKFRCSIVWTAVNISLFGILYTHWMVEQSDKVRHGVLRDSLRLAIPENCPGPLLSLILGCLDAVPQDRPTARYALDAIERMMSVTFEGGGMAGSSTSTLPASAEKNSKVNTVAIAVGSSVAAAVLYTAAGASPAPSCNVAVATVAFLGAAAAMTSKKITDSHAAPNAIPGFWPAKLSQELLREESITHGLNFIPPVTSLCTVLPPVFDTSNNGDLKPEDLIPHSQLQPPLSQSTKLSRTDAVSAESSGFLRQCTRLSTKIHRFMGKSIPAILEAPKSPKLESTTCDESSFDFKLANNVPSQSPRTHVAHIQSYVGEHTQLERRVLVTAAAGRIYEPLTKEAGNRENLHSSEPLPSDLTAAESYGDASIYSRDTDCCAASVQRQRECSAAAIAILRGSSAASQPLCASCASGNFDQSSLLLSSQQFETVSLSSPQEGDDLSSPSFPFSPSPSLDSGLPFRSPASSSLGTPYYYCCNTCGIKMEGDNYVSPPSSSSHALSELGSVCSSPCSKTHFLAVIEESSPQHPNSGLDKSDRNGDRILGSEGCGSFYVVNEVIHGVVSPPSRPASPSPLPKNRLML